MKKILLSIIFVICFLSCKKEDSKSLIVKTSQNIKKVTKINENKKKINLDYFESIPDTIDGCCYSFNYDSISKSENKYIFISNISDFALIKVKGKEIYLKKDTVNSKQLSEKIYKEVYFGNGYKTILNIEEYNQIDESYQYKGTLEVISDGVKINLKVKGEGGC